MNNALTSKDQGIKHDTAPHRTAPHRTALKIITALACSATLFGCQSNPPKSVVAAEPTTVTLNYNVGQSSITAKEIRSQITEDIANVLNTTGEIKRFPDGSNIYPEKGSKLTQSCFSDTKCTLTATYINGKYYADLNSSDQTVQKLEIPLNIVKDGDNYNVTINLDGTVNTEVGGFLLTQSSPLLSQSEITQKYSQLAKLRPVLSVQETYNGEFELADKNTSDVIVYANFKRLMGLYERSSEETRDVIGMSSIFRLNTQKGLRPLGVSVYPTRAGTLVSYKFTLPYKLNPDGTSDFDQGMVDALKANIKKVANM